MRVWRETFIIDNRRDEEQEKATLVWVRTQSLHIPFFRWPSKQICRQVLKSTCCSVKPGRNESSASRFHAQEQGFSQVAVMKVARLHTFEKSIPCNFGV